MSEVAKICRVIGFDCKLSVKLLFTILGSGVVLLAVIERLNDAFVVTCNLTVPLTEPPGAKSPIVNTAVFPIMSDVPTVELVSVTVVTDAAVKFPVTAAAGSGP